jgi:hypothetical protein
MEFASPNLVKQGNSYGVSYGDDSGLYVQFKKDSIPDLERSASEGRACFKDIDIIEINMPGSTSAVYRPVNFVSTPHQQADPERFPKQWAAYKNQEVQSKDGTPLEEWGPITKSQCSELKAINIHTVEDLVACPDGRLTWMGAREMQEKAKLYVEQAKGNAPLLQLKEENDKLRRDLEAFKLQVAGMNSEKKTKEKVNDNIPRANATGG